MLDPGPDFAKTPAQTVDVLAALEDLHALGRPLLLAVSRKDFIGALTGRAPRERLAGTLAAIGHGVQAGAHLLRVHDVAAAADFLTVRAALRRELEVDPELQLADELRREQGSSALATALPTLGPSLESPVAGSTRPEPTDPSTKEHPCPYLTAARSRPARSPIFTRSPRSCRSTATAACAGPS